ncbi:MAG: hypothetical protein HY728_06335 [Candidatus Rokubacteria bacterium]|nr:hypothetical protein [Candidatus Rokubacteria bacterium]
MKLKFIDKCVAVAVVGLLPVMALAANFEITPGVQTELDKQKQVVAGWAADPVIANAVKEQNVKGPMAGMDNPKWKTTRRSDPVVKAYQANPAGQYLKAKLDASGGAFSEAFLNGGKGEKVAFFEKTTSYIHAGSAKHDVPFSSGKSWQGKPEFDESSQTYALQISVPVMDGGKPIGSLVVGVNLTYLEKVAKK